MSNTILNIRLGERHLQIVRLRDWLGEIRMGRSPITFRHNPYQAEAKASAERAELDALALTEKKRKRAVAMWLGARPIAGTPAEAYLRGRGIDPEALAGVVLMSILPDPISGGDDLTNSAGIDDRWSCPNCYADHDGYGDGDQVQCGCGATLVLTIEQQPVCRATAIAFNPRSAA